MDFNLSHCISIPTILDCEVLIVGAGVGGSTLAHELLKAGLDVLMIEEGPFIKKIIERSQHKNFSDVWRNGGLTIALGNPPLAYAEGCCVGGGSEINSGIFQPATDLLLDEWAKKYSINEFSANILKPFYQIAENIVNARYLQLKLDSLILEQAAKKLNWHITPLKIAEKNNIKQSMCNTLLPEALKNGLRLIAQCRVTKLILKNQSIVAVKAIATDHEGCTHAVIIKAKYVFLCAGAIQTPHLLLKSGIKGNIGNTLQMHPTIKTLCQFKQPISLDPSSVPSCAITEFMPDIRIGGSVMSQDFIGMSIAEDWNNRKRLIPNMEYCGIYYAMIRPEGKGKIRSIPGCKDPLVSYSLTKNDWQKIIKALDYLQQAMFAADANVVFPSIHHHPGWKEKTLLGDISTLAYKKINLMTIHLFSSCPMGENQDFCAVDSYGKMHQYKNLYINDASIIPEALGTNPQATIMALTLRNAQHFIYHIDNKKSWI